MTIVIPFTSAVCETRARLALIFWIGFRSVVCPRKGGPMKRPLIVLVLVGLLAAGCGRGQPASPTPSAGLPADAAAAAAERGLTPDDIYAAVKTYTPSGQLDPYIMIASGGQSGQMLVIGVPSMRILKVIGVFT